MVNKFEKFKTKNGFTLVEIMIVVFIIALLAAIAIPNYTRHTRRARASEAVATMTMIRQAMRDYYINNTTHYDVATGNLANNIPAKNDITLASGAVAGAANGVDINVGVAQYFSNAAFSIDAIDHASARFLAPGPVDFVITADGGDSDDDCTDDDCALNNTTVSDFILEMDNTARVFISFDDGANWSSY